MKAAKRIISTLSVAMKRANSPSMKRTEIFYSELEMIEIMSTREFERNLILTFGFENWLNQYPHFSGTVRTASSLDREKTAMYSLQVETRSRSPDQHLYWTLVQISVQVGKFNNKDFFSKFIHSN